MYALPRLPNPCPRPCRLWALKHRNAPLAGRLTHDWVLMKMYSAPRPARLRRWQPPSSGCTAIRKAMICVRPWPRITVLPRTISSWAKALMVYWDIWCGLWWPRAMRWSHQMAHTRRLITMSPDLAVCCTRCPIVGITRTQARCLQRPPKLTRNWSIWRTPTIRWAVGIPARIWSRRWKPYQRVACWCWTRPMLIVPQRGPRPLWMPMIHV
jgi:hypothetical protein